MRKLNEIFQKETSLQDSLEAKTTGFESSMRHHRGTTMSVEIDLQGDGTEQ
jgi:hypothetical protein